MHRVAMQHVRGPRARRQSGAALIVALVMLLVMTIIGVTASRTSTLQERMAGNMRQRALAFEVAETTLRVGEAWIQNQVGGPRPFAVSLAACGAPPCDVLALDSLAPLADATWTGTNTRQAIGEMQLPLAATPRYYIEQQQFIPDSLTQGQGPQSVRIYYRITARALGESATAESILRSTFAARF